MLLRLPAQIEDAQRILGDDAVRVNLHADADERVLIGVQRG